MAFQENPDTNRRDFLRTAVRLLCLAGLGVVGVTLAARRRKACAAGSDACGTCSSRKTCVDASRRMVWQLDPQKCIQCGQCATHCVLQHSAVRCFHVHARCGYCELCFGYFEPGAGDLDSAAENQLCPTGAIQRRFVEEPYFEYVIDQDLCIGCGKCVRGCTMFGNGSLMLQVRHDICLNCNECSIARACPADAFRRVPAADPYLLPAVERTEE